MPDQIKTNIAKMIYNLNTENRAQADKYLKQVVDAKIKKIYSREYEKVKQSFSKENV